MPKGFAPPTEDEKVLMRRVADAIKAVQASGKPRYLGFLNLREQELATAQLNRMQAELYVYDGGFESAERLMLCVFEDLEDIDFPISYCTIQPQDSAKLTHRDYLGALLGSGLQRSCIGDIVSTEKGVLVALQSNIVQHVLQNLTDVGRSGVHVEQVDGQHLTAAKIQTQVFSASVASLRLDAVLAAMLHQSRTDAAALVQQGRVQVNHLLVETLHHEVTEGDVFSIRGHGKYRLCNLGGKSRKQRTFIEYEKYS